MEQDFAKPLLPPDAAQIQRHVRLALAEDLFADGQVPKIWPSTEQLQDCDLSLRWLPLQTTPFKLVACQPGVLCGQAWFAECFAAIDRDIEIDWHCRDGQSFTRDQVLAKMTGKNRSILLAERTALNYIQLLSATASLTQQYVSKLEQASKQTQCYLLDTRKTIPSFRHAQKYAVRCGGGSNHRIGLYDALMFKDNHVVYLCPSKDASRSPNDFALNTAKTSHPCLPKDFAEAAWQEWRQSHPDITVVIEVDQPQQLARAIALKPQRILLDNFSPDRLKDLIEEIFSHSIEVEVSGDINLDNLCDYANTGADYISIGRLTKNITAIDFSLQAMET